MAAVVALAVPAQGARAQNVVADATRLRDAGDPAGAAKVLRPYVGEHPEDVGAVRVFAQSLYWSRDVAGARAAYETALAAHPSDVPLRLEFAQMLVETASFHRAGEVLAPVRDSPVARARAEALLGTAAYWQGDLTTARELLRRALAADPTQREARRQLGEIASVTAPWLRIEPEVRRDDQPLERAGLAAEFGWFATPLTPVTLRLAPARFTSGNSLLSHVTTAEFALKHAMPVAHWEFELAAGAVERGSGASTEWTGRAVAGLRLPHHVLLRARGVREPYLSTLASLRTSVMTQTAGLVLSWDDPRGWLGEAALQREGYPDDNAIGTAYAWLLAPVARGAAGQLRLGYAFSSQNAGSSRYVPAQLAQPYPPSDPRYSTAGLYSPYFTPSHQRTHSAVAAATLHLASTATLHANGSVGARATDEAPSYRVLPGAGTNGARVVFSTTPRTFSPWAAHLSLDLGAADETQLSLTGDAMRTAFYHSTSVGIRLTYRFSGAPETHATKP